MVTLRQKQVLITNLVGSILALGSIYVLWSREMALSDNAWITLVSMLLLLTALVFLSRNNLRFVRQRTKHWLIPILVFTCNICLFVLGVMIDVLAVQDDMYLRSYYPSGLFVLLMGIAMPFGMIWWHWSWSSDWKTSISKIVFRFCYVGLYSLLLLWSVFGLYLSTLQSI